ncbi:MAG: APC family permease [Thermoflexales bacterium]
MKVTRTSLLDLLFGKPLATADASHQAISKRVGLAVFASDAMSSIAYATQEILLVLALVGTSAFVLSIPISLVIVGLLIVLTLSYRQTIFAYPNGGGAYIVAKDNLGKTAGMVAAAALLTDYVLTVAVSVSNGVEQIASAIPGLVNYRWELAALLVVVMTLINMRGVKESGTVFAIPTYFFLVTVTITLISGLVQWLNGTLATVTGVEAAQHAMENLSLLIILRAFSNGCTALTGVEAISNGVLSFKEPRGKNAADTLLVMSVILGSSFLGITLIAQAVQVVPAEFPTVISQIGSAVFGNSLGYFMLIAAAAVILIMAANTSFNAFPLLSAQVAADGFIPRWFTNRGNKLTYNTGIGVLALAAIALIVIFDARVTRLIPLYAIGVFMSFTLSQFGMVARWTRAGRLKKGEIMRTAASSQIQDPHWQGKRLLNLVGAIMSSIVAVVFAITKFTEGAWIIIIVIPALVYTFHRTHVHYQNVARILSTKYEMTRPTTRPMRTIILVDDVHRGTHKLVEFAKSIGHPWLAAHIAISPTKADIVQLKWHERIGEGELHIIASPYRRLTEPIVEFVLKERDLDPNGFVHVVMGQLVMDTSMAKMLHANNALGIMSELQRHDRIVVTDVPYQLHGSDADKYPANTPNDMGIDPDDPHQGSHSA